MNKWLQRLLVGLGCLLVLIVALAMYLSPPRVMRERGLPEYAKNLPSRFVDAEDEFDRRVRARFRLPLAEDQLMGELSKDGFTVHSKERGASIERRGFPCALSWKVFWGVDKNRQVDRISGRYQGTCL